MQNLAVDEMKHCIITVLPESAHLEEFSYNPECFGNVIACINQYGKRHVFLTDRGEIYHNNRMIYDSSYDCNENEDTFQRLLQIIRMELLS